MRSWKDEEKTANIHYSRERQGQGIIFQKETKKQKNARKREAYRRKKNEERQRIIDNQRTTEVVTSESRRSGKSWFWIVFLWAALLAAVCVGLKNFILKR